MPAALVRELRFQVVRSRLNEPVSANMDSISVTELTFHRSILKGGTKFLENQNICFMLLTPERLGTSVARSLKLGQLTNATSILCQGTLPHCRTSVSSLKFALLYPPFRKNRRRLAGSICNVTVSPAGIGTAIVIGKFSLLLLNLRVPPEGLELVVHRHTTSPSVSPLKVMLLEALGNTHLVMKFCAFAEKEISSESANR